MLRANRIKGIARLDDLAKLIEYFPIRTVAIRQAAQLWAQARQHYFIATTVGNILALSEIKLTDLNPTRANSSCISKYV